MPKVRACPENAGRRPDELSHVGMAKLLAKSPRVKATSVGTDFGFAAPRHHRHYMLRFARLFPPGPERNERRQIALALRQWFENKAWLAVNTTTTEMISMQKFFFDMKDGVPMRDQIGIEFSTNAEAIIHCKELAQHWRDGSLRDDKDLEISVVNSLGREIHREYVHRDSAS
jgi:hypothetical protein